MPDPEEYARERQNAVGGKIFPPTAALCRQNCQEGYCTDRSRAA